MAVSSRWSAWRPQDALTTRGFITHQAVRRATSTGPALVPASLGSLELIRFRGHFPPCGERVRHGQATQVYPPEFRQKIMELIRSGENC
jgi:hypothetical protein